MGECGGDEEKTCKTYRGEFERDRIDLPNLNRDNFFIFNDLAQSKI